MNTGRSVAPRPTRLAAAGMLVGLLAGCAGLSEEKPGAPRLSLRQLAPTRAVETPGGAWPRAQWWLALREPALNGLIETAVKDSPTLKSATLRLQEAEALGEMRAAALLPQVASGMSLDEMRFSKNSVALKLAGDTFSLAMINPILLRYHVDVWGRDCAALEEALGLAQAEAAEHLQARLLQTGALARGYFGLRLALAREPLARDLVEAARERVRLLTVRLDTGLGARQSLLNEQARLEEAEQRALGARLQSSLLRHQLGALCGRGPDWTNTLTLPPDPPAGPPALPNRLPFHLLTQRPDVVAARLRADAAAKAIEVARTAFYPDINIRGFAGLHSITLVDVLFHGSSLAFAVGPSLELPIFEGGRLEANMKAQETSYDLAVESYNTTLVHALQQAADRFDEVDRRTRAQANEVAALREAWRLDTVLQEQGLADAARVLEQRQALGLQTFRLKGYEADRYQVWVDLVESLGGGLAAPERAPG